MTLIPSPCLISSCLPNIIWPLHRDVWNPSRSPINPTKKMVSFCPLSGTILFLVAHTIRLFLALWADLPSSTDRASQTFLSTSGSYWFLSALLPWLLSVPFYNSLLHRVRGNSLLVSFPFYIISFSVFFPLKVHHLRWGFTEASPKPVPPLSTVCVVFHCVVVTLATSLLLQPTEPSAPWGLCTCCVFWRHTSSSPLQGCLLLGLYGGS